RGMAAVLLGVALAAPALLPLAELGSLSTFYRVRPTGQGDLVWGLFLDQSRRTLSLALFAPALLELMRNQLAPAFPSALGPALGILGLVAAVTGILCRGIDAALALVALLGVGLGILPPGLRWLHQIPGLGLILPRYAWVLVALPLTQSAGRGVAAFAAPGDRRRIVTALALVLAGFTSLALVRDYFPLRYGSVLREVLATSEGLVRLLVPPAVAVVAVAACLRIAPHRRVGTFAGLAIVEALVIFGPYCRQDTSMVLRGARQSPAVQFLQTALADGNARMLGIPSSVGQAFTPSLFALPAVGGVFGLPIRRYLGYLDAITPLSSATLGGQSITVRRSPLLDLGAVRYLVLPSTRDPPALLAGDPEMPRVYADDR